MSTNEEPKKEPAKKERQKMTRRSLEVSIDRWQMLKGLPAWSISVVIHVAILLGLSLFWRPVKHGTGGEANRPFGIALVHRTSEGNEYTLAEGNSDGATDASTAATGPSIASGQGAPIEIDSVLGDLLSGTNGTSGSGSVGEQAGTSNLSGTGVKSGGRQGSGSTPFYGIEGKGDTFVYVLDRSDSMNEGDGRPLRSAKRELTKSIDSLHEGNLFQIIFYNDSPLPFRMSGNSRAMMINAGDNNRKLASRFVNGVIGLGGTEHVAALKMAIGFQPDVIFFLTDADQPRLGTDDLRSLVDRCADAGTTIHAIEFGRGPNPEERRWIQVLAESTGGKFRYVDVNEIQ